MKITFKQVDEQHVNILCGKKKIGHIFSPSGSSGKTTNAIQVCGFEDAYDLWGCGLFGEVKTVVKDYSDFKLARHRDMKLDCGKTYETKVYTQKKDIQLLFTEYDNSGSKGVSGYDSCYGCFNDKCSCDSTVKGQPMKLKSSFDEEFKKKLEGKDLGTTDNEGEER